MEAFERVPKFIGRRCLSLDNQFESVRELIGKCFDRSLECVRTL